MPKRLFQKYLPDPEWFRDHPSLRFLGEMLADPNLWHINRRSLGGAAFIGIFCGFLPIPFQMAVAALLALRFSCNLPFSVVLVWFSNPVTYVPVFFFTYKVGAYLLGIPPTHLSETGISLSNITDVDWIADNIQALGGVMVPLWVGSLTCGLFFGTLFWIVVRIGWRLSVMRHWHLRRKRRDQSGL
jgi:uncharacterized protein (DUF2062 family)